MKESVSRGSIASTSEFRYYTVGREHKRGRQLLLKPLLVTGIAL